MSPRAKPKRKPGRPRGRADVVAVPIYLPREQAEALEARCVDVGEAKTSVMRRALAMLRKREGW